MKRMWKKSKIAILILILLLSCIILVAFGCQAKQQELRSAAKVTRTSYRFVNALKALSYVDSFEQEGDALSMKVNCETERFSVEELGLVGAEVLLYHSRDSYETYGSTVELTVGQPFVAFVRVQADGITVEFDLTLLRHHDFTDWDVTLSPTCTEEGRKEHTCTFCHNVEEVAIAALGHDYPAWTLVRPVTCTEESEKVRVCRRCETEDRVITPAPGHDLIHHDGYTSCTEPCYDAYDTCRNCDYTTLVITPAPGHKAVVDPAKVVSCTENGCSEGAHCSVCGEVLVPQEVYPALGHDYQEKSATLATCTEAGVIVRECSRCHDETREVLPALGHSFDGNLCTRCGYRVAVGLQYRQDGDTYYVSSIGTYSDSELYIPSTYEGLPIVGIDVDAFRSVTQLTSVTLPDSITYIGANAFRDASALTSLTLPNSVTYIGQNALLGCDALTEVTAPRALYAGGMMAKAFSSAAQYDIEGAYLLNEEGVYVSPEIGHGSSTTMAIRFRTAGSFEMQYRVSSEANFDFLRVVYNGTQLDILSGETGYIRFARELVAVGDTIQLIYSKDNGTNGGADRAYVRIEDNSAPAALSELHVMAADNLMNTLVFRNGSIQHVFLALEDGDISDYELDAVIKYPVYYAGSQLDWQTFALRHIELSDKTNVYFYAEGHGSDRNWQFVDGKVVTGPYGEHYFENENYTCVDRVCSCGYTLYASTNYPVHKYSEWQVREATCTVDGERVRTCELCGNTQRETLVAPGHVISDWITTKAVTCTVDGERVKKCTVCQEVLERETIIASHNYVNGECTVCGETLPLFTRVDASGAESQDGEYLLFGEYPQTLVTDSATIDALNQAASGLPTPKSSGIWRSYGYYNGGDNSTDYMWYTDRTVSGKKYRGVYFTSYRPYSTTSTSTANNSYQDDNGYYTSAAYWFAYEPIKWRILEDDNGDALILAELILDSREFYRSKATSEFEHNYGTGYANDYALSDIRKWLNDTFYRTAFTSLQRKIILLTTVDNSLASANPNNGSLNNGVNDYVSENTEDYIFLLSEQEVTSSLYGFNDKYTLNDTVRNKYSTDYVLSQGVWKNPASSTDRAGYWWLRSPAAVGADQTLVVAYGGSAGGICCNVSSTCYGVVPALRIHLHDPIYTRVDKDGVKSEDGEYLLFGKYPQTEVTDSAVISALNEAVGLPTADDSGEWVSYGYYQNGRNDTAYMWYVDRAYKGSRYRGVYFTSYRPYYTTSDGSTDFSFQDDNGYVRSTVVYWFKYEPILWRILEEENQEALLLSELILDSREFDYGDDTDNNTYRDSTIRAWLNDTFYDMAFTDLQRELILLTTVQNGARTTNPDNNASEWNLGANNHAYGDTEDYIFLLSEQEVTTAAYGFDEASMNMDAAREKKSTDYAKAQGTFSSETEEHVGSGRWWLRSPNYRNLNSAFGVSHLGAADYASNYIRSTDMGVVPALRIRLVDSKTGKWSEGLSFAERDDGTYEVTGIGSCTDTVVVIPTKYEGKAVTAVAANAFKDNAALTSVVIPRYVQSIGEYAFSGCSEMGSVSIPGSVTVIGTRAFNNCKALISVSLPSGVTTLQDYAFSGCTKLTSISLPATLTAVGNGAFVACNSIVQVTVAEGNPVYHSADNCLIDTENKTLLVGSVSGVIPTDGSVTVIDGGSFWDFSFTTVTVPEGVTSIAGAFFGCKSLTSVSLPASLTTMDPSSFAYCSALATIRYAGTLEQWCALSGLHALMQLGAENRELYVNGTKVAGALAIPSTVTKIEKSAFYACTEITSVDLPLSVTYIGNYAFAGCTALLDVYYNGTAEEAAAISVQVGNDVLSSATWHYISLAFAVKNDDTYEVTGIGTYADSDLVIPASRGGRAVTSIATNAFKNIGSLTSVTIPNSVTSVGNFAFYGCSGLTAVSIGDGVTIIGESAFSGCSTLSTLHFGKNVRTIGYAAFSQCSALTSIILPQTLITLDCYAFSGCTGLTSIHIPTSLTNIRDEAFGGCSGLTTITVQEGNTKYHSAGNCIIRTSAKALVLGCKNSDIPSDGSVLSLEPYAFSRCSGLISLKLPNTVTSIGSSAFNACVSLASVSLPSSLIKIGPNAFYGCTALASIDIPSSVTSIGGNAFYKCNKVRSITVQAGNTKYHSAGNCLIETESKTLIRGFSASVIPADGSITRIEDDAFAFCDELTAVVIPNEVTSIGSAAFTRCNKLASVEIGNGVESIEGFTLSYCESITSLFLPNSIKTIKRYAFRNSNVTDVYYYGSEADRAAISIESDNDALTSATWHYMSFAYTLKGDDTYKVTGIGTVVGSALVIPSTYNGKAVTSIASNAFNNKTTLTSVYIPSSVTSIGQGAFSGCSSLETMTIPFVGAEAGKTENDTYQYPFGYIFGTTSYTGGTTTSQYYYGSSTTSTMYTQYVIPSSLRRVTVTGGNLLYGAFYNCKMIESVTLEDGVNIIGTRAFYYCSALTSVTLPSDLTAIPAYTFYYCTALSVVTIPSNVTSIGSCAFDACRSMSSITIPASVTSIGSSAFYNCNKLIEVCNLSSLTIRAGSSGNGYVGYYAQNVYTTVGGSKLSANADGYVLYTDGATVRLVTYVGTATELSIPANVTIIHDYAFYNRSDLLSVTIPNSVTSIGNYAVYGCTGLSSLAIPNSVTAIGNYAFYGCKGLSSLSISNSVTSIGNSAFYNCTKLTSVFIPNSVTSIGSYAFYNCSGLISLMIPSSVTSIGEASFAGCSALASITVQNGNTKYRSAGSCLIETSSKTLVLGCKNSVIPTDGSVTKIGNRAFYGCTGLTSLTIPSSVIIIGDFAFDGCTGLTSISIPNSVSSIGISAFNGCYGLTSLTIGSGVTSIGSKAFSGCSKLTAMTIPASVKEIGWGSFEGCTSLTSVTFENTSGWWLGTTYSATSGTAITVTDPMQNATYFKSRYVEYYWHRS